MKMDKSREKYLTKLLYNCADHNLFSDYEITEDILNYNFLQRPGYEYIDIYDNAYQQKPELFQKIEDTFDEYINSDDFEPSPLMWKLFKTYFNEIWTYATNSYYEGYPLPEKMEFVNLLDLDIDLI